MNGKRIRRLKRRVRELDGLPDGPSPYEDDVCPFFAAALHLAGGEILGWVRAGDPGGPPPLTASAWRRARAYAPTKTPPPRRVNCRVRAGGAEDE